MHDPAQYPQYPQYPQQPSAHTSSPTSSPAAVPARRSGGAPHGRTIAISGASSGAILLALLLAVGVVHYNGPVDTVKGFMSDLRGTFQAQAALSLLCPDARTRYPDAAALQQQLDLRKRGATLDVSGITYQLTREHFLSA